MNTRFHLASFLLVTCFLNLLFKTNAQEQYQASKIIPPSPTAASLGVYGDLNVGYYTGLPDINIPLYEIKTANHTLPIRMNYNSSGIRVSENAGWVGLSWSLSAGGVITRTIRGGDDFGNNGYYNAEALPLETNPLRLEDKPYFDAVVNNQKDAEPDIISYNFANFSGNFVLGKPLDGSKIFLANRNNFKIEFIPAAHKWVITTGDGYQYHFGSQEGAADYYYSNPGVEISNDAPLINYTYESKPDAITAWYLDKIISPSGETISFEYQIKSTSLSLVNKSESEYSLLHSSGGCASTPTYNASYKSFNANRQVNHDLYLTKITFKHGTVEFNTSDRDDIEYLYNAKPKKLSEILVKDAIGNLIKKFSFGYSYFNNSLGFNQRLKLNTIMESSADGSSKPPYTFSYFDPNSLPPKYTKSIDHWGFYNGRDNNSLLPPDILETGDYTRYLTGGDRVPLGDDATLKRGVLKTITYPTGGSTNFDYETHVYRNPTGEDKYMKVIQRENVISTPDHRWGYESASFDVPAKTNVTFSFNFTKADENAPSVDNYPAIEYAYVYKTGANIPIYTFSTQSCPTPNDPTCGIGDNTDQFFSAILNAGSYRIEVAYISGYQTTMHAEWADKVLVTQRKGGGLRVKSIRSSVGGNSINIRKFIYEENNLSTGILLSQPVYAFNIMVEKAATNDCYHTGYFLGRMSSSINGNGLSSPGATVGYDKVIELLGENGEAGKTEHIFYNGEEFPSPVPFLPGISNPLNGKEAVTFIKDAAGNAVKKIDYNYETKYSNYLKGVKIYQPPFSDGPGSNSYEVKFYNNTSYWTVLNSQKETIYTSAGTLANSKNFYYDNADHMEITRQEFTNSDGKTEIKKFKYPGDYPSAGSFSFVSQLRQRHIISPIIEEQTFIVDNNIKKLIGGTFTEYKLFYNAFYKPAVSHKIYTNTPLSDLTESAISSGNIITLHPNSKPEVYFDNYDPLGNIRTFHKANDIPKSYVWGYNGTYPVAEVIGSSYETISGMISQSVLDDPLSSDLRIRNELNKLRSGLASSKALVTTYTYKPFTGTSSQTDANGRTTYYDYDTFGRLRIIKDHDGKILQVYDYKYTQ